MTNQSRRGLLDSEGLDWLAQSRGELPQTLLGLRKLKETLGQDAVRVGIWQLLVGAGFALWRALPLFEAPTRDPSLTIKDADQVLYELVAHNRITYVEEQKTQAWFAGYYLNDARWRIEEAKARIQPTKAKVSSSSLPQPRPDRDHWKALHRELKEVIAKLSESRPTPAKETPINSKGKD